MEMDLPSSEDLEHDAFERPMYNLLRATLQYPADTESLAAKLAEDIVFICQAEAQKEGVKGFLFFIWTIIIDIARCVPPDHPWQDCLVRAIHHLRQREGIVPGMGELGRWRDLPDLVMRVREEWEDDPIIAGDEEMEAGLTKRKNFISFVARLTTSSFAPWLNLPLYDIRDALEEPLREGPRGELLVWVACEWLERCTQVIFEHWTRSDIKPEISLRTGSLCGDDIPQVGVARWEFWKKRLGVIAADAENLKLDSSSVERISETLARMSAV
ncbi:hypothetical protein F5Y14DRAFT_406422 [Nemania sp. NC0429]|nr:hypothetical protein F5Y14DRAFT_406422 [Nemania sp. NC0429]